MLFVDKIHTENILQQLWQNCENEELCDVVLISGDRKTRIPAHRNILSAVSEYFRGMFQSSMRESKTKEIKMPSANGAILRSLIEYTYIGRVAITEDNAVELLKLADLLLLSKVVTACGNFLLKNLHPSNCLGLALFAEQHPCEILLKKAKNYCLEHFMDVSKTQEFLRLNSEQLGSFLANDNLCVSAEENVFQSLMTWIRHDKIEREKHRDQLLKFVRLPLLERSFLIKQVKPICTSHDSFQLYVDALEQDSLSDHKIINARKSINSDKLLLCLTKNLDISGMEINFYYPQQRKWLSCLKGLKYREDFGVGVMHNNLYLVGGRNNGHEILNTVICINLKTMTIGQINPMTEPRTGCGVAAMNGFIYAIGGGNGWSSLSSVEKWNPKTNSWSKVASMSEGRQNLGIAKLNGKLYAVGGTTDYRLQNSAEYYDIHQNIWKAIAPMNSGNLYRSVSQYNIDATSANDLLYVASDCNTVERYDPRSNKWSMLCSLPISRIFTMSCTRFCNKVLVCSGDQFYEYNDKTNQWETNRISDGIKKVIRLISYSGELPVAKFDNICQ